MTYILHKMNTQEMMVFYYLNKLGNKDFLRNLSFNLFYIY